ncbi:MAG: hypothetical protein DYG89_43090 [Caldilinea sp. CFX5]|nr:hypothetical protein [Caldilinea sp. CFX5]
MYSEEIDVAVTLPRALWEALQDRAQSEHKNETTLLVRAIEQLLEQTTTQQMMEQQLARECAELAGLEFDDVGTEDEWLVVQNEALHTAEATLR